jgi:CelD/BcsL family acetyltransferase involved in cellulose biosynthesis
MPVGSLPVPEAGVRLTSLTVSEASNPAFVAQWDDLACRAADPNPFCESWFLLPSLRHLDPDGEVRLLALESGGQLSAIIPLRRYPSYYGYPLPHWRNWVHDNAFCGQPLVAPGFEVPFWRAVLRWTDAHTGQALFLHLTQMPAQGPIHAALKDTLANEGRAAATVHAEERAMLASTLSAEAYLEQAMPGKKRKELRRQQRRLTELGTLEVQRLT